MRKSVLARDLMRHPVRQLTAWTPVREAAAFLLRQGISGAPVIDEHGRWIGVFTLNDLARSVQRRIVRRLPERTLESRERVGDPSELSPAKLGEIPVKEFMTTGLFTVFPDATLEEVVHALTEFGVHRLFVIGDERGELLGVITTMDVLRWMDGRRKASTNKKTQRV